MFKCAFLGCGPRARGHARAYKDVRRGKIAAICDLDEKRLNDFGTEFGVATRYRDAHEMLEREKPDLLHIVTVPGLRVPLMTIAVEHKVPVAIVEKPIALQGEDWRAIKALGERGPTKFAVNTQLHFHARNLALKHDVAEGRIGDVRFVDVSARSTPLDQGVHVLELAHSYNGFEPFASVFGQVGGPEDLASRQPAPAMAAASLRFANGVSAMMVCGLCAPLATTQESRYHHKRISVYGTGGFVQWTMWTWERQTHDAGYESGAHNYGIEDDLAQARLTEACFDWLGDPAKPHPCRLERSLAQFNAILGLYTSALSHKPVELPCDPPDGLLEALKARLTSVA
ncbi:MAG TPA: Gfo/Idh/MocA family oxidoreductase [Planctomycetota bacterium]|nr:Gfo/Idh/MocA family oxidoreductase [Planctomycetota bacterium]